MPPPFPARSVAGAPLLLLLLAASAWPTAGAVARQSGDKAGTVSFTDEDSSRGEAMYAKQCGPCHDDKSLAPLLTGAPFEKNWSDKSVGALFEKIRTTMPLQDPGTLSDQQSLDLTAYILKINHFSSGPERLTKDGPSWGALLRRVE